MLETTGKTCEAVRAGKILKKMNVKVENLIKQEKERLNVSKKQMRDNHLIRLGLIDENKTERKYQNYYSETANKFDSTKNMYYTEINSALEITDEEYEEICKYSSPITPITPITLKTPEKEISETGAESTLSIIAILVLVCGIIGFIICLVTLQFITSIWFLLTSLTTWSLLRIFCEIAINIRQINNKTK